MDDIVPLMRCSSMRASVEFYTGVLDFVCEGTWPADADPSLSFLSRKGRRLYLSSHRGDGVFGNKAVVIVSNINALFEYFRSRGLVNSHKPDSPVHQGVVHQTWGTFEFFADDPDGNSLCFVQE